MIVAGVICFSIGLIGSLWANNIQQSFEYSWYNMWGSSDYAYVDVIYYLSIPLVAVGIILVLVGCIKKYSSANSSHTETTEYTPEKVIYRKNEMESICSFCKRELKADMSFCPYCGAEHKTEVFCTQCGKKINEDAIFCSKCGMKVRE